MKSKILIASSIFLTIGLIFVGRMYSGSTASVNTASVHGGQAGNPTAETRAVDFSLQKLDGGTITLSEFRGKKPVVVDFWASWCPNCQRDMPNLNRFYEKYKDKVEVIGVNLQERDSVVRDFIESKNIAFPIALDPFKKASNSFRIQYTNTHFLIDINGNLVRTIPGDIRESDIISLIEP